MKKKVLILGGSRYYLRSIEAARRAGYQVIVVDRNHYPETAAAADGYEVCDIVAKEGVLEIARRYNVDGIMPVNDYGVPTAAFVAARLGLRGISEEAAFLATNKEAMRRRWIEMDVPCPKLECWDSRADIEAAILRIGFPCILKPAHGVGGASRGVIVVRGQEEVQQAIDFSQSFFDQKATLIEEFIDGRHEHSAEVLVYDGIPYVIAISDKIKTPLPYRVDKAVLYPTCIVGAELENLKREIGRAVLALGINCGVAHVEGVTTRDGFVLFELGARCGGGGTPEPIVAYATGVSEFVEAVRILCGDSPEKLAPIQNKGCSYHFFTPRPGVIGSVRGVEEIRSMDGVLDVEFLKAPGEVIKDVSVGTERSGFVITGADTSDEAYKLGLRAEALLEIEYAS